MAKKLQPEVALLQEDDKQQASAAGFDHHLTKPADPKRLRPLIESVR